MRGSPGMGMVKKTTQALYTKPYFPRRLQKARDVLDYWKIRKPRLFIPVPALPQIRAEISTHHAERGEIRVHQSSPF